MLDMLRRAGPALQWVVAVAFLVSATWVGTGVVRQLRAVTGEAAATPSSAAATPISAAAPSPPNLPAGAVSLPVLLFDDGKGLRVGDPASHVATLLGRAAETGRQDIDGRPSDERLTRFYEYRGRRFALVFSLAESHADPTITGIYLE